MASAVRSTDDPRRAEHSAMRSLLARRPGHVMRWLSAALALLLLVLVFVLLVPSLLQIWTETQQPVQGGRLLQGSAGLHLVRGPDAG